MLSLILGWKIFRIPPVFEYTALYTDSFSLNVVIRYSLIVFESRCFL